MTENERYLLVIETIKRQTEERLSWPPEKLREWIRQVHGPEMRELEGNVLKLIGHYTDTNNQRTHTYFYKHNNKEYRVTYGLYDDPLVEEVLPYE